MMRGHHLICMHFYSGKKQPPGFYDNMKQVVERAELGEWIIVTDGPDDICIECAALRGERCEQARGAEEEIRELDRMAQESLQVVAGDQLLWQEITCAIDRMEPEWIKDYCRGCTWKDDCRSIY